MKAFTRLACVLALACTIFMAGCDTGCCGPGGCKRQSDTQTSGEQAK